MKNEPRKADTENASAEQMKVPPITDYRADITVLDVETDKNIPRIQRDAYLVLPQFYRIIADVAAQTGKLIIEG